MARASAFAPKARSDTFVCLQDDDPAQSPQYMELGDESAQKGKKKKLDPVSHSTAPAVAGDEAVDDANGHATTSSKDQTMDDFFDDVELSDPEDEEAEVHGLGFPSCCEAFLCVPAVNAVWMGMWLAQTEVPSRL